MEKTETDQIIDAMLSHARKAYDMETVEYKKCLTKVCPELQIITARMNNPQYIPDKDTALRVCHMLIKIGFESGGMEEGSIAHLLGMRLYDYIKNRSK